MQSVECSLPIIHKRLWILDTTVVRQGILADDEERITTIIIGGYITSVRFATVNKISTATQYHATWLDGTPRLEPPL